MKYFTRIRQYYEDYDDRKPPETMTVFEDNPINTGLLDENGLPIFRVKDEIGFKIR